MSVQVLCLPPYRPTQENDPMGEGPVLRALVEMIDAPKYTEISANDQYDKIK